MKEFKKFNGTSWQTVQPKKYDLKEFSGTPPFSFESDGGVLQDWSMSGQTVQASTPTPSLPVDVNGVGERTGNLFNASTVTNERITWSTGATFSADDYRLSEYIPVETAQSYTCSTTVWFIGYDSNKTYLGTYNEGSWDKNGLKNASIFVNNETLGAAYIRILKRTTTVSTIMLNVGSAPLPYEPFGYKVPVNVQSENLWDEVFPEQSENRNKYIPIYVGNGDFTFSTNGGLYNSQYAMYMFMAGRVSSGGSTANNGVSTGHPRTVTAIDGYVTIVYHGYSGDYYPENFWGMLNRGSTPLPYQPYSNTTTNIYLSTAVGTRRVKKLVFTGSEDEGWSGQGAGGGATRFRYPLVNSVQADTAHLTSECTHLPLGVEGGTWSTDNIYTISSNYLWLRLDSSFTTVSALKSWLAQQYATGTPVTVWYGLATAETSATNEQLMKIGNYADEINLTNSGINISTVEGNNTLTVNTTIQPSSMSIKKGLWENCSLYEYTPNISGAPPFTFKSDGENLRDWSMDGQSVQASTPTPSSPVDVSGVGEKTANLFDRSGAYFAGAYNNVYTISGLDTSLSYTCSTSLERISGAQAACVYFSQSTSATAVPNGVWAGEEKTFTPNENGELYVLVRNTAAAGAPAVADDVIAGNITIMINTGSTVQPYEPYGYKVPVNVQSGNLFNISDYSIGTTSFITKQVTLEPNTTYTMSSTCPLYNGGALIVMGNIGETFSTASNGVYPNHAITRTTDANGKLLIGLRTNGSDYTISDYDTMLNSGSTPLPYQPYSNTTTNVYLGQVASNRRIKKLVLTGTETVSSVTESAFESGAYCFAFLYSNLGMTDILDNEKDMRTIAYPQYISSHFQMRPAPTTRPVGYIDLYSGQMGANAIKAGSSSSDKTFNRYIILCVNGISTIADFKDYLSQQYANGTPVTIWYVTEEGQTSIINTPLMKIGSYTDELTKIDSNINIPTTNGLNTLMVNTTIQPSDMNIESISQWIKQN